MMVAGLLSDNLKFNVGLLQFLILFESYNLLLTCYHFFPLFYLLIGGLLLTKSPLFASLLK